ncbi:hypothetical protein FSU_0486 [Fibrobacter succinogenes subsp. succinogenes S85]|uniref:Uncharacterized protein n=1 Tax=Fibrobacter succinogenes (strain ATCC 19169 / S85) TaxID=59374 RepID=D9S6J2_FIBSS|nr:hypothetical protein FSU_0486 [Fibrobacter succinogenes subsp. succinogenes S85]
MYEIFFEKKHARLFFQACAKYVHNTSYVFFLEEPAVNAV